MAAEPAYSKVYQRRQRDGIKPTSWLREFAAWLSSLLLLVCIVIILAVYQNKPRPDLSGGITLNALIAVIIKVGLMLLVVPLAAAVGQWKWLRVREARTLTEFAAISDAAQNPWACITLLVRFRGGLIAAAGAILVLSTQAIETFVQQAVHYPVDAVPNDARAVLAVSDSFRSQAGVVGTDIPPSFAMKSAVYNGLFANVPNARFSITPTCTGVRCSWQDYYSLGFCSTCANITDQVRTVKANTRYRLPDGLALTLSTEIPHFYNASVTGAGSIDEADENYDGSNGVYNLKMTFLALRQDQTIEGTTITGSLHPVAARCNLSLCIRKYANASFDQQGLMETPSPSLPTTLKFFDNDPIPQSNLTFTAEDQSWSGFAYWLNSLISGTYVAPDAYGDNFESKTDSRDAIFQVMTGTRNDLTLESLFNNVAASLTAAMRTNNIERIVDATGPVANGTTYIAATIVKVEWGWLAFPFAVWAFILVYLVFIILANRGGPIWKDRTIATLCHGLDENTLNAVARLRLASELESSAKEMHVRLADDATGLKLRRDGSAFLMEER